MASFAQEIALEEEHILRTLAALQEAQDRSQITLIELSAMATFLHNIYSGMENLLKRALRHLAISLPSSASSHKDLLDLAVEHNIITQALSEELDAYRGFRHFFVHGYGTMLDKAQLMPLVEQMPKIWTRFKAELVNFATEH
ncbi:MAG: HepT-like ribonuclease domain-containing protein [Anaerolineae bacterium]